MRWHWEPWSSLSRGEGFDSNNRQEGGLEIALLQTEMSAVGLNLSLSWPRREKVVVVGAELAVRSLAVNSSSTIFISVSMSNADPETCLLTIRRNSGGSLFKKTDDSMAP